jgi:UDPglucose--hexose-1-phosphate uridylyltransferase
MSARPTTAELRRDPLLRRWVIIAPERVDDLLTRPATARAEAPQGPCPFCPGNEERNPHEILRLPASGPWSVRVTPDRHPLLHIEGDDDPRAVGMCDVMNAVGAHELVTDVPDHDRGWADFGVAHMSVLLGAYRERLRDLRRDRRFRHGVVLMNHATLWSRYSHAHSHVIATPFTPTRIDEELRGAREYHHRKERCVYCDQIAEETAAATRIVTRRDGAVALTPFASAHPYEVWVLPEHHAADFTASPDATLGAMAAILVDVAARLRQVLGDPAYSVALHAGPFDATAEAYFHWHWEIVPHLGLPLGVEWATGLHANAIPPEIAAARLRQATPGSSAQPVA